MRLMDFHAANPGLKRLKVVIPPNQIRAHARRDPAPVGKAQRTGRGCRGRCEGSLGSDAEPDQPADTFVERNGRAGERAIGAPPCPAFKTRSGTTKNQRAAFIQSGEGD